MCSPIWSLIDNGKLANQIARLVATVVKLILVLDDYLLEHKKLNFIPITRPLKSTRFDSPDVPARFVPWSKDRIPKGTDCLCLHKALSHEYQLDKWGEREPLEVIPALMQPRVLFV